MLECLSSRKGFSRDSGSIGCGDREAVGTDGSRPAGPYPLERKMRRTLIGYFFVCAVVVGACGVKSRDGDLVTLSGALTATQQRILGFEAPTTDWSSPTGTLGQSTTVSQGSRALSVVPNNWTEIDSVPLSSLGAVKDTVSYDIRLPQAAAWGETRLVLVSPSLNLFWQELGSRSLTTVPAGSYQTIQFPLPAPVKAALQGQYSDLRFKVVINGPVLASPYLVDNIDIALPSGTDGGAGGGSASSFSVSLPTGLTPPQVGVHAQSGLRINDRGRPSGFLVNLGGIETNIGADAVVPSIWSVVNVVLRDRARVEGNVRTSGTVALSSGATVTGSTLTSQDLSQRTTTQWSTTFPSSHQGDRILEPGTPPVTLAPGAYGNVVLKTNTNVSISTGTYWLESLTMEPGGSLRVDTSQGPVFVYVRGSLIHRGAIVSTAGPRANLLFGVLGSATIPIEAPFVGTLVAPNAFINVLWIQTPHVGAFFGTGVEMHQGSVLIHEPFAWSVLTGGGSTAGPVAPEVIVPGRPPASGFSFGGNLGVVVGGHSAAVLGTGTDRAAAGGSSRATMGVGKYGVAVTGAGTKTGLTGAGAVSCVGSWANNLNYDYVHEATDYTTTPAVSTSQSCADCGGTLTLPGLNAPAEGRLTTGDLRRIHRPRLAPVMSSFGPGVFSNYDDKLFIVPGEPPPGGGPALPRIRFYDIDASALQSEWDEISPADGDNAVDGVFHDVATHLAARIELRNSVGVLQPNPALAATATVIMHSGERQFFELVNPDPANPAVRAGRWFRWIDTDLNEVSIRYVHPATAGATPGFERDRLWQIAEVVDMYGISLRFTYGATRVAGRWAVSLVQPANGALIEYRYDTSGPGGGQIGQALSQVLFPDGSRSNFTRLLDTATQAVVVRFDDHAVSEGSVRKDVYFTQASFQRPDGTTASQTPNMVRQVLNGNGELAYANFEDAANPNTLYIYEGGGSLLRLTSATGAMPDVFAQARSFDATTQSPAQAEFVEVESYRYGSGQMLERTTDTYGHVINVARNAVTRAVTSVTHADGTQDTRVLNAFSDPTVVVDRLGKRIELDYNATGHIIAERQAAGTASVATFTTTYNGRGQPTRRTDANGNATDYVYDTRGFLTEIQQPPDVPGGARPIQRLEYDAAGRVSAVLDAAGRRRNLVYDSRNRVREVRYVDGTTEQFTYDGLLVTSRKDRNGNFTTFGYDSTSRLLTQVEGAGSPEAITTSFEYLSGTRLKTAETRAGNRTEFQYDARKRLTRVTRHVTASRRLTSETTYDIVGRRFSEKDEYGRATYFVYDANDRPIRTIRELVPNAIGSVDLQTLGRDTNPNPAYTIDEDVYDARGRIVAKIDGRGIRTELVYDILNRMVEQRVAVGRPEATRTIFQYDAQGNRVRIFHPRQFTEPGGFFTDTVYSGRNQILSQTMGVGRPEAVTRRFTYTPTGKRLTETDGRGNTVSYTYDDCCDRELTVTDQAGFVARREYDPAGNVVAVIDPAGNRTTRTYDHLNRMVSQTNGAGETATLSYDDNLTDGAGVDAAFPSLVGDLGFGANARGSATVTTNALGQQEIGVFDGAGRAIRGRDGNGNAQTFQRDAVENGLLKTAIVDALGNVSSAFSDAADQVRRSVNPRGDISTATFDAKGNPLSKRDGLGVGLDCTFDGLGRRSVCTDTSGSTRVYGYDANGNQIAETDALGRTRNCRFDALNRKVRCDNLVGGAVTTAYDQNGNVIQQVDAEGFITTQQYDARNLLLRRVLPDGSITQQTYDAAKRPATYEEAGGKRIQFVYDGASRVTERRYNDEFTDTFAFDAASRLLSAHSGRYDTTSAYVYDAGGRMTRETQTVGGVARSVNYEFDAGNRRTALVYPGGKRLVEDHDQRGNLTRLTYNGNVITNRSYDAAGRLSQETLRGGLTRTISYRPDGRITRDRWGNAEDLTYTFNAEKERTAENDAVLGGTNQTFAYDAEHHVVDWTRSDSRHDVFEVSREGDQNRITRGTSIEQRAHRADHAITSINGAELAYDARGNLTATPDGDSYTWSVEGRLDRAVAGGATTDFLYDALGRRLAKTGGGHTTVFVHAGHELVAEFVDGVLERSYIHGPAPDQVVAIESRLTGPGGGTRLHTVTRNHLNTVTALVDSFGAVAERYRYTAFGARTVHTPGGAPRTTSIIGNPLGFTGRYHDAETGLAYFEARYYSPSLGRFISRDAGYLDGMNLYHAYFAPNGIDPTGRFDLCDYDPTPICDGIRDGYHALVDAGGDVISWIELAFKPIEVNVGFDGRITGKFDLCGGTMTLDGRLEFFARASLYGVDQLSIGGTIGQDLDIPTLHIENMPDCGRCGTCCGPTQAFDQLPLPLREFIRDLNRFEFSDAGGVVTCQPNISGTLCNSRLGIDCRMNILPLIPIIGGLLELYDKLPKSEAAAEVFFGGSISICRERDLSFKLNAAEMHVEGHVRGSKGFNIGPADLHGAYLSLFGPR